MGSSVAARVVTKRTSSSLCTGCRSSVCASNGGHSKKRHAQNEKNSGSENT